jgi:hypothetical protein
VSASRPAHQFHLAEKRLLQNGGGIIDGSYTPSEESNQNMPDEVDTGKQCTQEATEDRHTPNRRNTGLIKLSA